MNTLLDLQTALGRGFGGLVLCSKPSEVEKFTKLAHHAGRQDDLIFFGPAHPHRFNFLDAVMVVAERTGLMAAVNAFDQLFEGAEDVYRKAAGLHLLNLLRFLQITGEKVTIQRICDLCEEADFVTGALALAQTKDLSDRERDDLTILGGYFQNFSAIAEGSQVAVSKIITSVLESLTEGSLQELFCTSTNIHPRLNRHSSLRDFRSFALKSSWLDAMS